MKEVRILLYVSLALAFTSCGGRRDYTEVVNPMVGSGGHGHVFVGANCPHGMVEVGPNNLSVGWDWCSGYHDSDRTITGFAQNHLSGTGIADLGEIILMPCADSQYIESLAGGGIGSEPYQVAFEKERELAVPGYYRVSCDGFTAELTATERVAFHRYSWNDPNCEKFLLLDLRHAPKSLMFRTGCLEAAIDLADSVSVSGYRISDEWARGLKVCFFGKFDSPVKDVRFSVDSTVAVLGFGALSCLETRIALSYNSVEAATANLAEADGLDFDATRRRAHDLWQASLSAIDFKGITERTDSIFYTALYHTAFAPQLFSDLGQEEAYTIFSTWDTYRAAHPLYTLIDGRAGSYVNSLVSIAERDGRLPVWHLAGKETDCMVGVHSVPIMADAAIKGVEGVDARRVYAQVRRLAEQPVEGMEYVDSLGYLPADRVNWSVSRGLEYCIDDDAVARLAAFLGDSLPAEYHRHRAGLYRNYFDPALGFMRGRLSDGTFRKDYDPSFSLHEEADYVEGNGWQYTWLVPHDPQGLISLFGTEAAFTAKLDSLFTVDSTLNEGASIDISGMMGQYAHGNEPSHHIAYLYACAGQQWKTARLVREICRDFYTTAPDGLIGNEDCGQMSAWYVLSALGLYPVSPVAGVYVFGSPLMHSAVLHTVSGHDFRIVAENNSADNIYIQRAFLNGEPYSQSWIAHETILKGGELRFVMGLEPSSFGSDPADRTFQSNI